MLSSFLITLWNMRTKKLPRILRTQLKVLIPVLIVPAWISDLLQTFPLAFNPGWMTNSYTAMCISTLLITLAAFYCARKVITLRFLNLESHVQSPLKFNFIDGFKEVLEQLSHVTSIGELGHITQAFFKEAFDIPTNKTTLLMYKKLKPGEPDLSPRGIATTFEHFMNSTPDMPEQVKKLKILIHDEIAFSNFYENNPSYGIMEEFLETINADIVLPIYDKQNVIAYIVIDRYAQLDKFYGDIERDEMLVFASYLSNIINLIQNRSFEMMLQQEKELREDLYTKHQEINQYKESVSSFLRTNKDKELGILFYKNRRFVFGNRTARELIPFNININDGHSITKVLKDVAQSVDEYKTTNTRFTQDKDGNKLVVVGMPSLVGNEVIIAVYYPEISDLLRKQIELLKDPTQWDYVLYLETTESGKLINQLIPGSGHSLLNFKVNLLKLALSQKAVLLEMPEEDLLPTVEIIHHISLREHLHIINLQAPCKNNDTAVKLFGINPLFGSTVREKPLLGQLDHTGTIFIKNIHFLDLETQEYLAEFIKWGMYRMVRSDQRIASAARIIFSTNQNLQARVHEGSFSKELLNELKSASVSMPSLLSLPESELSTLADGFTEQAINTNDLKNLLELSDKEKSKIAYARPVSLHELKERVQQLLVKKSKDHHIYNETHFDPAYQFSDPQLVEASRMGKHALRDPRVMAMLWNKFKSQSKIAEFLSVNRSSVNRRCKEYKLLE